MRKRFRVLILAAIVAAVVVPVGFALSLEPARAPVYPDSPSGLTAVVAAQVVAVPTPPRRLFFAPVSDSAKLLAVGALLVGLAAIVRKATDI